MGFKANIFVKQLFCSIL